jgi:spermidine synthase
VSALLWIAFTLSGAGALGLELLWLRSAALVLGTTAATTATVLAGYFAGLAIGSVLARQPAARPIRCYALLELGVAAGAIVSYATLRWLGSEGGQALLARAGLAGRVAVVGVVIVPVTIALGATLPTLCHALAAPRLVGRRGGALYALNNLGGVAGVAAMGFGLPASIGVHASYVVAASANALAGLVALAIGDTPQASSSEETSRSPTSPRSLWLLAAGVGCLGVALEVMWTVLFAQVLHNSVYSFAAVSLVFLLALAVGAALSALALRTVAPVRVAAASLTIAGVTSVVGFWSFVRLTGGLQYVGMQHGLGEYVGRIIALAIVSAGPPALASGAALPALWAAFGVQRSAARPVGELTAANLLGAAIGALTAGFVVLPWAGVRGGFLVGAVGYLIMGALASADARVLRGLAYAGLVLVVLLDPI